MEWTEKEVGGGAGARLYQLLAYYYTTHMTTPRCDSDTGTRSGTYDTDTDIGRQVCFCFCPGTDVGDERDSERGGNRDFSFFHDHVIQPRERWLCPDYEDDVVVLPGAVLSC